MFSTYIVTASHRARWSTYYALTTTKASLRQLASSEGRCGSEISSEITTKGGQIIVAHHSLYPCALRTGYSRGWDSGVNDHPDCENPIHVVPSQKVPVLKGPGEKKSHQD
ncbi:hypothetical protein AVEN_263846-1 [Araneus ventricosus]|uniref:Uncharacterized protein n=1 Tax=Araneus ventricosus TaxID=182803 RepID=A0A4Y2E023_ARAVE|nr:hypothetical protein AVEN_263846-1 [Araneus ventricosus]